MFPRNAIKSVFWGGRPYQDDMDFQCSGNCRCLCYQGWCGEWCPASVIINTIWDQSGSLSRGKLPPPLHHNQLVVISFHGDSLLMLFLLLFLSTCNIILQELIKWVKCLIRVFQIALLRWDIFYALSRTFLGYHFQGLMILTFLVGNRFKHDLKWQSLYMYEGHPESYNQSLTVFFTSC